MSTCVRHCAALLFIAAALPVGARGQMPGLTPEELTSRAEVVAVGTVADVAAEWNPDRTRITTVVTISVEQYLKGERSARTMTLAVPGGEIGEVGEVYSHVARFLRNEQVVVFAEPDGRGRYRVSGGDRGKMTVREDPSTRTRVVADGLSLEVLKGRVRTAAGTLRPH